MGGEVATCADYYCEVRLENKFYCREENLQIWKKVLMVKKKSTLVPVVPGVPRDLSLYSQEDGA
jgi:hypothetical protein